MEIYVTTGRRGNRPLRHCAGLFRVIKAFFLYNGTYNDIICSEVTPKEEKEQLFARNYVCFSADIYAIIRFDMAGEIGRAACRYGA
jgi:hypothetical protein